MSCNSCNPTGCTPDSNSVDANCQCVPNSAGAAYCDPRFANLPSASHIKLMGASGECLANFPSGKCGLIFFNENGYAQVTSSPAQDLPALINWLADAGQADGLARQDGALIESIPPTFDHLMVMESPCPDDVCCTKPEWKKWRGPAGTAGYVLWNGTSFEFGGINADGIVTSAILDKLSEAILVGFPVGTDPEVSGTKTLGYICPTNDDLYHVDPTDGLAKPLNPTGERGFVWYGPSSACDSTIVPQVVGLCEIATPPCEEAPVPAKLVGCNADGDPAATLLTELLADNHCNKVLVNPGDGGAWSNASIGGTFFPGNQGTVRQDLAASGSFSVTVSSAAMTAAAGYTLPTNITHVIVHVRAVLRKSTSERSRLTVDAGGVGVVEASAYSWDGSNQDEDIQTATAVIPVNLSGGFALDINHSNVTSSTYDVTVNISGVLACAELETV